jgi:hypothetical protein
LKLSMLWASLDDSAILGLNALHASDSVATAPSGDGFYEMSYGMHRTARISDAFEIWAVTVS